jgi:hypothetical protein
MSRFNQYMNTHFAGCQLLAEGYDKSAAAARCESS